MPNRADVQRIVDMYRESEAHAHIPNRRRGKEGDLTDGNRAQDYISIGASRLAREGKFQAWWDDRAYALADKEVYSMDVDG